jgi:beta-galactosidase GanA
MQRTYARAAVILAVALSFASAQKPIPQLVKKGDKFSFVVDGKPFLILGGQVGNFSAFPDRMERAWPKFQAMNANVVEYPVYWNVIEPQEGKFDFREFDVILQSARAQKLRVDMLWFGTWKNGAMDWTPNWVKSDPRRFPRVIDRSGNPIRVLSPHSTTTLEADRNAYATMMKHLREIDEAERTVILMQVENEAGILGSVRDYSPESNQLFNGPVPQELVSALKKQPGSWKEIFGRVAEETFTAYYLASYINEVAHAGKQVYPLVTYVNNWNGGYNTNDNYEKWDRPGESYPSGGPVSHMLDLWKATAPNIDILGSDTSSQPSSSYRLLAAKYARPDNPHWSPEAVRGMTGARNCFYALADFSAIGFGAFGVDGGSGTALGPQFTDLGADYRLFRAAMPAILDLQQKGELQAAVEEDPIRSRHLIFDRYDVRVHFRPPIRSFLRRGALESFSNHVGWGHLGSE